MEKKCKKKRKYRKINLLETSVVGIPAYPDAHLAYKKSQEDGDKSVTNNQLNTEQVTMEEPNEPKEVPETVEPVEETVEEPTPEPEEPVEEPKEEEVVEETPETPEEEVKEEEPAVEEKPEEEAKSFEMVDLKKAITEALKEINEERALVEKEAVAEETQVAKSLGELAVDLGFFK
jgi:hypothetical protein